MLDVMMWDVDHGSAIYVNTPTGKHIAIDLGVGDMSSGEEFSPLDHLNDIGVDRLDKLVITHPHRDHLDDIGNLFLVKPRYLCVNRAISDEDIDDDNREEDEDILEQYKQLLKEYQPAKARSAVKGAPVEWGCNIQHFRPEYDGPNLNDYSIVTVISHAGSKIVVPGDNEAPSWRSLLKNQKFVDAIKNTDVFVASHHGRDSGYFPELFDHFTPKLVLISDTNHGDTSATDHYSSRASGWRVDEGRTGVLDEDKRYSLTTRYDGNIRVRIGTKSSGQRYLVVSTEF